MTTERPHRFHVPLTTPLPHITNFKQILKAELEQAKCRQNLIDSQKVLTHFVLKAMNNRPSGSGSGSVSVRGASILALSIAGLR